jgi:hypothetical protein
MLFTNNSARWKLQPTEPATDSRQFLEENVGVLACLDLSHIALWYRTVAFSNSCYYRARNCSEFKNNDNPINDTRFSSCPPVHSGLKA